MPTLRNPRRVISSYRNYPSSINEVFGANEIKSISGENIMKRTITLLLVLMLGISTLAGCYSGSTAADPSTNNTKPEDSATAGNDSTSDNDGSSCGIDLASTELQQMSGKRAMREKLEETVREWLEGATIFPDGDEMSKRTYGDFVDYIGCDATEYKFDDSYSARMYTWKAEDSDNSKLSVWFVEKGGTWSLSFTGSANL